jgi:hypothetical protein
MCRIEGKYVRFHMRKKSLKFTLTYGGYFSRHPTDAETVDELNPTHTVFFLIQRYL